MRHSIHVKVNNVQHESEVEPRLLLAQYLREGLNLTGTHIACDTGQCGACTVLVDGQAIKSCMMLAVQADGADVRTVEGLKEDGAYHPVQQAFWDLHGLQCGYCTPGFLMASVGLLQRNPNPSEDEIREELSGNLCRCTGYQNIVAAVRSAADTMRASASATPPAVQPAVEPYAHGEHLAAPIGAQHVVEAANEQREG
jgi:aerobic carbon-monoxide dehydrogenase small subunit